MHLTDITKSVINMTSYWCHIGVGDVAEVLEVNDIATENYLSLR
jgi:hypothetical protein